jgi:uncharacterized ParB-like nuclease family protein
MTKLLPIFLFAAALASASTFTGVITESMCGMDHAAMNMGPDAECIRQCVKADKNVKYVLNDGKHQYKLSDQQTPEKFAAQRVTVSGTLFEKTGIIKVEKIEPAR